MSPRENNGTTLPSDEIRLLPYQKTQNHTATVSEDSVNSSAPKGIWPSLFASPMRRWHNLSKFWAKYRSTPWNMCLLVVFGTAFAIGHHLFYLALEGREATNQSLMLRYGTILAFCAKASFGVAAAMAFQQRAWLVVRHKMARLETVDSIFTANTDIFSLLTWPSIKKAKIGTLIAVYCWITPLVVVLTSETLSVVGGMKVENGTCPNVRTLNFSNEIQYYWRTPIKVEGRFLRSASYWNTTAPSRKGDIDKDNPNEFDYWGGPDPKWQRSIGLKVALGNKPVFRKESGPEICYKGWNCSYVLNFTAPGYKCEELASGVNSTVHALGDAQPPFNTSILAPMGNLTYYANVSRGEYTNPQIVTVAGGRPKQKPPYPKSLGAFRTEPVIWIGYSIVDNYTKTQPLIPGEGDWYRVYTPVILGCEHYEVNYTVQFDWMGEEHLSKVLRREYLRKLVNTTFSTKLDSDERLKDRTRAVPESNYVLPTDVEQYRLIAAYNSLGYYLRSTLSGETRMPNSDVASRIGITPLFDPLNYLPVKNLSEGIRGMYENMILSLFADPSFLIVSWASNGQPTGTARSDPSSKGYPCRRSRHSTFFKYDKTQLLSVYAGAIALATACVLLGLHAFWEEGKMRDMKPSSIIEASRASHLHTLDNTSEVKIGYGVVHEEAGRSVRSFGVEGILTQPERVRDP